MAFQKTLTLPSGVSGNYSRLITYRWDRSVREAMALFALYIDANAAHSGKQALTPFIAKLRLTDAKFDQYLSNAVLENSDVIAQLYTAAKAEPVISDFGSDVFADAINV
jgi:hypothetical protein